MVNERLRIDIIESNGDLERIRDEWDRVYDSDPGAQYFLSWAWLRSYLRERQGWFILALRESEPGSPHVAFFPLRLTTEQDPATGIFRDDIMMAGRHAADYTGMICDPGYEAPAIDGFARFLKSQSWTHLRLDNFWGPAGRIEAFLRALDMPDLVHHRLSRVDSSNVDNAVCPIVMLPGSWQSYLDTTLGRRARQKLRRLLRLVETDKAYRITVATPATIDSDLDVLFGLWRARWGKVKGDATGPVVRCARELLVDAFRAGDLFLPILWHEDRPLAAIANLLDRGKKAVLFYLTGRDEDWKTPSPGLVLHAYAIRQAIAQGFRSYDFLRGNEPYKYLFGAGDRAVHCAVICTRSGRNLGDKLNLRSIGRVYETARSLYAEGQKALAEAAFTQILSTVPGHVGARFGLAQLLFDRGRLAEAENALHGIADRMADPAPVLMKLGDVQLALRKFSDAAGTFGRVIERQPNACEAYFKRGVAFAAAGNPAEAIRAFEALDHFHSDDPRHAALRAKARDALLRLYAARNPPAALPPIHPRGFPLVAVGTAERSGAGPRHGFIDPALAGSIGPDAMSPSGTTLPLLLPKTWQGKPGRTRH